VTWDRNRWRLALAISAALVCGLAGWLLGVHHKAFASPVSHRLPRMIVSGNLRPDADAFSDRFEQDADNAAEPLYITDTPWIDGWSSGALPASGSRDADASFVAVSDP
jgi:hypothetical protein